VKKNRREKQVNCTKWLALDEALAIPPPPGGSSFSINRSVASLQIWQLKKRRSAWNDSNTAEILHSMEDPPCNNPIHPWFISTVISFQCTISDFGCGVLASWEAELTLPAAFGRSPGRRLGFTEHQPIGIQGSRSKTSQHWGREKAVEGIFLS